MRRLRTLAALLLIASGAIGLGRTLGDGDASALASTSCHGAVDWSRARGLVGRYATVEGPVAGARYVSWANGSPTFINLGRNYPDSRRVQIVIWREHRSRFGAPERRYRGHTLCVRGRIENYLGTAQIEATRPSEITIAR